MIEVVGSSPATPGVAEGLVCDDCDGEGLLEGSDGTPLFCNGCRGRGGMDAVAVSKARRWSFDYGRALGIFDAAVEEAIVNPPPNTVEDVRRFEGQTLAPLGSRLWVRLLESEQQTAGGIWIPQTAQERARCGRVLAVGPEVESPDLVIGALVVLGKYAGTEVELAERKFLVIREEDTLGTMVEEVSFGERLAAEYDRRATARGEPEWSALASDFRAVLIAACEEVIGGKV